MKYNLVFPILFLYSETYVHSYEQFTSFFFTCISYKCIYVPFSNIVLYFAQYYIDIYIYIYIYNKNIDIDVLTCICVVSFRKGIQLIIVSTVYCLLFIHRIICVLVDK